MCMHFVRAAVHSVTVGLWGLGDCGVVGLWGLGDCGVVGLWGLGDCGVPPRVTTAILSPGHNTNRWSHFHDI